MTDQAKGVLLTTIGVIAIIPDSLLIRLIDADILVIAFWRSSLAGVALILVICLRQKSNTIRAIVQLRWSGAIYTALSAFATLLFVVAIETTTVASTLFIVSTTPVFSAIMGRFVLREPVGRRMIWTILLSIIGIGIIVWGPDGGPSEVAVGDFAALGVALCLSISYTVARRARRFSMVPAAALSQLLLAFVILAVTDPFVLSGASWAYALVLGGMLVPLGTAMLAIGPRYITAAEVSLLLLLEAALAPVLVWLVLGETPSQHVILGGVLLLTVLTVSNLIGLRSNGRPA